MANRSPTISDGVPQEVLDEITDRLGHMTDVDAGWDDGASKKIGDEDLARVLASFEADLMRLNRELRDEASVKMKAVRAEYEETREVVSDLNADLNGVVKENIG